MFLSSLIDGIKGKTYHLNKVVLPSLNRFDLEFKKCKELESNNFNHQLFLNLSICIDNFYNVLYNNKTKTSFNLHVKNINPRNAEFMTITLSNLIFIQFITDLENVFDYNISDSEKFIDYTETRYKEMLLKHEEDKYNELWDIYVERNKDIVSTFEYWYEFYWNEILGLPPKKHVLPNDQTRVSDDKAMFTFLLAQTVDHFREKMAKLM